MSTTSLQSSLDTRSITEVVIRAIATHIFALANYGHFGSLIKLPKNTHIAYTAVFFLYPTFIIGQLVYGLVGAIKYRFGIRYPTPDWCFYIQGLMGVHAMPNEDDALDDEPSEESPIPLFKAGHLSLQCTTYNISWKLFGRVLVCLAVVVQAIGTFVLFVRRLVYADCLILDTFCGVAALGSAISGTGALLLLLMRKEWQVIGSSPYEEAPDPGLTALCLQLVTAFLTIGWIRGSYFFGFLLSFFVTAVKFPTVVVCLLIYIFRRHIVKIGWVSLGTVQEVVLCSFAFLICTDSVMILIIGILELTGLNNGDFWGDWKWKDPLSDQLLVI
jgi:hypothetical protein